MARKRRKRIICPNCSNQLKDKMNYCYNCGQENHIKRVSVKMLFADFFSTYFTFDSKLFKSLKFLISTPSFLSREYLNGKIESYIRPIRFYIFISFVFFFLSSNVNSYSDALKSLNEALDENPITIGEISADDSEEATPYKKNDNLLDESTNSLDEKVKKIFSNERESSLFLRYLISKSPIFLFVLIPFLGLLFLLLFYRKGYYYIDHLVFVLHLQTFLFVLLIFTTLFDWAFKTNISWLAFFGLLIYGFVAAIKFYKRALLSTLLRLCLVGVFHSIISLLVGGVFFLLAMQIYSV